MQINIQHFIEQNNQQRYIKNERVIDKIKKYENTRLLILNPNRLRVTDSNKIQTLINKCKDK